MKGVHIGCIVLELARDLHVTIARRWDASPEELVAMKTVVDSLRENNAVVRCKFGNFCQMGENGSYPAYRVYLSDGAGHQQPLIEIHDRFYKEAPGKAMYPKAKFHVTVDIGFRNVAVSDMRH